MSEYIKVFLPTILLGIFFILSFSFAGTPLFWIPLFISLFTTWLLGFFPGAEFWALERRGGWLEDVVPTMLGWLVGFLIIIVVTLCINHLIVYIWRKSQSS